MSFALMCVALLQLTVAAHQFEHVAGWVGDSCHVCIQLDRIDDAVTSDAAPSPAPVMAHGGNSQPQAGLISRAIIRGFDSRAPPSL